MIEHTATGRLVTLNGLTEHSKQCWPSLGHYIGTMGVLLEVHPTTEVYGPKANYEVQFDASPSMPVEDDQDRKWMCEANELTYISLMPGHHATFRISDDSLPELVIVTKMTPVDGKDFKLYDFIILEGGQEFTGVPEQFLRPYPYFIL